MRNSNITKFFIISAVLSLILIFPDAIVFAVKPEKQQAIGVCTGISNSDLLKNAGYAFVEEGVKGFLMPAESDGKFLEVLKKAQQASLPVLACNSFIPSEMKCVGEKPDHPAILKYAETAFSRARQAGVKIIVFGSGGSRRIPDNFPREVARDQFIGLCRQMAPLAKKYGITIVLEPLNLKECNFINSVAEGGEIVKEVHHPGFRLLADLYHMKMDGESADNILKYGHLLRHVHIAEKEGRSAPGTFNEDFTAYFKALEKVHYKGMISIECKWQDMEKQLPVAIQAIRKYLE